MLRNYLALMLFVCPFSTAAAQSDAPWIKPGVYSAQYRCPLGQPTPIEFYVLDSLIPRKNPESGAPRQGVRIEANGGQFLATVSVRAVGDEDYIHFTLEYQEREPSGGWGSAPYSIMFEGRPERMVGRVRTSVVCPITPSNNGNTKTLASMSFPPAPESEITVAVRRYGLPSDAEKFTPPAAAVTAYTAAASRAVIDDSESWRINRLLPNTIKSVEFYRSPAEPAVVYAVLSYDASANNYVTTNRVMAKLDSGKVECLRFHDNRACRRLRESFATATASLPRLSPMPVAATCFAQRTISVAQQRQRVVGRDSRGNVDLETETYYVPGTETVFTCPSQSFELVCRSDVIDRTLGSAASVRKTINLVRGRATDLDAPQIQIFNSRIRAGTCLRVR